MRKKLKRPINLTDPLRPDYAWSEDFAEGYLVRWVLHFNHFDVPYRSGRVSALISKNVTLAKRTRAKTA